MKELTFNVYVPSYQRYGDKVRIYDHLEYCTYVVRKSEEAKYRVAGIERIWSIEDSLIDSMHKVFQYIIDESPEDVICIVDDDGKFMYRNIDNSDMTNEQASSELERVAQMMVDLNIGYGCTDANPAPFYYDQEFKFKGMSGGCKWFNKAAFGARIDPATNYNFDLDLELQELLTHRVIFKPVYFIDVGGMDTNAGGSNVDKNQTKRIEGIMYTKSKWGKYFDYNFDSNKAKIKVQR